MSSDAFVDVTWRGLEVGRRVKLHRIRPGSAYLDHGTPMPVGTVVAIKTDDGVEIVATVRRVHEQVGGSTEVPGMHVVPALDGAAAAWWQAHAEPEPVEAPALEPPPEPVADPEGRRPTVAMSVDQVAEALAAAARIDADTGGGLAPEDNGRTQVMPAMSDADLAAMDAGDSAAAAPVDEGARTMVMSAVDVSAIVDAADAASSGPSGDADEDGPSQDGPTGDGGGNGESARGKKKVARSTTGRRKKR